MIVIMMSRLQSDSKCFIEEKELLVRQINEREEKIKLLDENDKRNKDEIKKLNELLKNNENIYLEESLNFKNIISDLQKYRHYDEFNRKSTEKHMPETSVLVNRHRKYMPSLIKRGIIPPPMGSQVGGDRKWQVRAYYSESQIKEIRDILATIHIGQPRKDNLITNNSIPTSQELTRRMGDGILTYTKTEDGRFIPVWAESIN